MIHAKSDRDVVVRPDVCIVGSGPGGAMVASRLARAGASVVVLEEGGYHTKDEFDMQESTAFPRLDPLIVASAAIAPLRECGLSGRKVDYLRDLASRFESGTLDPKSWRKLDDDTLIAALVEVKGIGRWTAEMFLLFQLHRLDVWPAGDLGLRRPWRLAPGGQRPRRG